MKRNSDDLGKKRIARYFDYILQAFPNITEIYLWGSLHATGSASPPTYHECYIGLGGERQDAQDTDRVSSHPQEENAQFIQLNLGLYTL